MKRVIVILLILLMAGGGFMLWRKQKPSDLTYPEGSEETAVLKAFETMQQAMIDKDMETLDKVIRDGTIFTHMSGKQQTKAEYFAEIKNGTLNYYGYHIADLHITVNENRAALTCTTTLDAKVYGFSGSWDLHIATVAITLCGLLIFQLIPDTLLALFNAQGEVLKIGRVALRIVSFVFPFSGLTLILGAFFQALGNSRKTLLTSVVQLVIMLTSAIILSKIGTVNTVWFAFVITEVLVAALAIMLMKLVYSRTIQSIPTEGTKISNHFAESVT